MGTHTITDIAATYRNTAEGAKVYSGGRIYTVDDVWLSESTKGYGTYTVIHCTDGTELYEGHVWLVDW